MARYHIDVVKSAKKSLAKIPLPWLFRIKQAIDGLQDDPYLGEKMDGNMKNKRKIRVWPYRIIYIVEENIKYIKIMEIEYRGHTSYD